MQGQNLTEETSLSDAEKQKLINIIAKDFFSSSEIKTGDAYRLYLQNKYKDDKQVLNWLNQLEIDTKDEAYGIITFTLANEPSPLEFRLKRPDAYSGPKTEHYLERIRLKIDAAKRWINQQYVDEATKREKINYVESLYSFFEEKIKKDCQIDASILQNLDIKNTNAVAHFDAKHKKAMQHLASFMDMLTTELNSEKKKPEKFKHELYLIEQQIMTKRRPERVTVYQTTLDKTKYTQVTVTSPVDKGATITSAKKDTSGVANWLKSTTRIYSSDTFTLLDERESYRSASIVPHEIINKGKTRKSKRFSNRLAKETAKRNVADHIIQALVREQTKQYDDKKVSYPPVLELNYEMLTLLSPISRITDKMIDPDFAQFIDIRDALEQYADRQFKVNVDGKEYEVKFNCIYHNYGANMGRGFSPSEAKTNKKAFNQLLDRSFETLNQHQDPALSSLKDLFFKDLPQFTAVEKDIISKKQDELAIIYDQISDNSKGLSQLEHKKLLDLRAKKLNHQPLSKPEAIVYKRLKGKFKEIDAQNIPLQKRARKLEEEILKQHGTLYTQRINYLSLNKQRIEQALEAIENQPDYAKKSKEYKQTVDHLRTLHEYTKLSIAGYDPHLQKLFSSNVEKRNERNYVIQTYIAKLNSFNKTKFHKTCKSGKDRTNAAEEKEKAKNLVYIHHGKMPKFQDSKATKSKEQTLFDQGYLHGPGNDICGDNMKPGAQQVSEDDVPSNVNIKLVKKISYLQKGIDKLKAPASNVKKATMIEFDQYREAKSAAKTAPTISKVSPISQPSRTLFVQQYPFTQAATTKNASKQEVLQAKNNNVDALEKHLTEDYKKCGYGDKKPQITLLSNGSQPKAIDVKMEIPIPQGTCFQASDEQDKKGIRYSVAKADQMLDSTLDIICRIAVNSAKHDTEFDLSNTPEESQEQMHNILKRYISLKFTGTEKPSIIGFSTPKASLKKHEG